ncbi:MAG: glycine zipper 2TM domain-containing protein [Burkholderiales bacterium]|nr:glycine zipper 2TM domain-containing protein [Burkholderiales bacterium]
MPNFPLLRHCAATVCMIGAGLCAVPQAAFADPPSHAPAHGWRKKHDPYYQGYAGKKWERDYGIVAGKCLREAAGAAIGGVVGGAIGSQVGSGEGRKVAIVIGSVLGAVIGAKIGRDLDQADRACVGHALELARDQRPVVWNAGDIAYRLTPTGDLERGGQPCRNYTLSIAAAGKPAQSVKGLACRSGDGTWQVQN